VPSAPGSTEFLNFTKVTSTALDNYYTCAGFRTDIAAENLPAEIEIPNYYDELPVRVVGGFREKPITKIKMNSGITSVSS
jgi:hypothetical protein